ncbi:MAG: hypothetical protein JO223_00540 [Hyphomicrobiales bacterium]|nr:hypothetical protein [Hyphomicrobiales bacterium]
MRIPLVIPSGAAALVLWTATSHAGPCTNEIYQADVALGKRLDAIAAQGRAAPESNFATMHRQPTPGTVARAEAQVGDLSDADLNTMTQDMEEARKADAANDHAGCEKALADVRRILGVLPTR